MKETVKLKANPADAVDAPIASLLYSVRPGRRATDQHCSVEGMP